MASLERGENLENLTILQGSTKYVLTAWRETKWGRSNRPVGGGGNVVPCVASSERLRATFIFIASPTATRATFTDLNRLTNAKYVARSRRNRCQSTCARNIGNCDNKATELGEKTLQSTTLYRFPDISRRSVAPIWPDVI